MAITLDVWQSFVSEQTGISLDKLIKRMKVQHWKDSIEMYDAGVFIALAEAIGTGRIQVGERLQYAIRQAGIQPLAIEGNRVIVYTYDRFRVTLLAEYGGRFEFVDHTGSQVTLTEEELKGYNSRRDFYLKHHLRQGYPT